jgi:hypothetical protein
MKILRRLYWFLDSQLGINPIKLIKSPYGILKYFRDFVQFRLKSNGSIVLKPCINDWYESAGSVETEYFWQDLIFAKVVLSSQPIGHIDLGSRLDGFVAHLASKIELNVLDVRPISLSIPNIKFHKVDILSESPLNIKSNSISCLHTIEHFGLGRYGDILDVDGLYKGLKQLFSMLLSPGKLYLSTPMGVERIEFNANRVSCPFKFFQFIADNHLIVEKTFLFYKSGYDEIIGSPSMEDKHSIIAKKYVLIGMVISNRN